MTLTRAPVEAESSVTELSPSFATQMWPPCEVMADGSSKPKLALLKTLSRVPLEDESSVTELSEEFATQMWPSSEVIPESPSKP